MPKPKLDYDPTDKDQVIALVRVLEDQGYYGGQLEEIVEAVTFAIAEGAKADCLSQLQVPREYFAGVLAGATAVFQHFQIARNSATEYLKEKQDAKMAAEEVAVRDMAMGGGTLS